MNLKFQAKSSEDAHASEHYWPQLKQAISNSSGFQRWALEEGINLQSSNVDLDSLIYNYLRQTLETLAY